MSHHLSDSLRGRARLRAAVILGGSAALTAALAAPVMAQHWSVHATGMVTTAVTSNVGNEPSEMDPEAAVFSTIAPAVLFTFESPRTVHVSSLSLGVTRYVLSDAVPNAFNGSLSHESLFTTSRYTELGLGATAGLGQVSATLRQADGGQLAGTPTGDTDFRTIGLNQSFRWDFARDWRLTQGSLATQVDTSNRNNASRGRNVTGTLGLAKSWARTSIGLSGSIGLIDLLQDNLDPFDYECVGDDPPCADSLQLVSNLGFDIRRDFGPRWSAGANLGVAALTTLDSSQAGAEGTVPTPSGSVTVNYYQPIGTITVDLGFTASHAIAPNLFLGTITRTGGGVFRGSAPLPWFRRGNDITVNASGSIGRTYSWIIDPTAIKEPAWHNDVVDLAAGWSPREAWTITGRYQFLTQNIDEPGEMSVNPAPLDFARHTFLIEVRGQFPTRQAASIPDRRQLRVDRANEEATGDEGQQVGGGKKTQR